MPDTLTPEQRRRCMSRVKGKDTAPELIVRKLVHHMGFRFRLHRKDLPGKPDIVLPRHKKVIFVHGCFWHGHKGCKRSKRPDSNVEFWNKKIDANIERDKRNQKELGKLGWKSIIIWECEVRNARLLERKINRYLT